MSDSRWFTLRGEQYQFDKGRWYRGLKAGEKIPCGCDVNDLGTWYSDYVPHHEGQETTHDCWFRVTCTQPFKVGDKVRVVRALNSSLIGQTFVIDRLSATDTWGHGCWIPIQNLEPAETSPDYIPIESVLNVLTYECSEYDDGHLEWWIQLPGQPVFVTDTEEELRQMVRTHLETLTPKQKLPSECVVSPPATPQPDVSPESQTDDRSPLDVYLPEIERKVLLASKANPELLDWWRWAKEALAIEAGKRMGGGM